MAISFVLSSFIFTCSAQLSMFHMERRSRNTLIITIIIIIIIKYETTRACPTAPDPRSAKQKSSRPSRRETTPPRPTSGSSLAARPVPLSVSRLEAETAMPGMSHSRGHRQMLRPPRTSCRTAMVSLPRTTVTASAL